ncbi:acylglycerol kinase, mitochondrial [Eurytemora carolleeae]|uniref:acylglycerol kinase, mitochondrial n=1 Tax=Eurytemora carolleeae TaxID=1294199 RepID=UPI000C76D599|nr:acylglycerol kinase, mitochondrial [Eurytemora carolleeae]|eukprot:XP_023333424.1 acylglycerol kinase, mitochondrial-like [Eurytemora affinis]
MERLTKIATTLRNNWKKTVVLTAAAGYGLKWNQDRLQSNAMMTACCREALNYGSITQGVADTNYHVTVILNPAASGGKGRKLFEQYSAPLLHLAGFKVSVQLTEGRNEAKELMKIMDNTDAVLIAGGDGTVMEAVTGMLRREDAELFRHVPIGIIPVGENNTLSTRLFPGLDQVRKMAESTMSVIKQLKKPINVIEVENLCENEDYKGKKLHALNSLQIGAWREAAQRRDSYWYWGGLKDKLCFVFGYLTAHKNINWDWSVMVESGSTVQTVHQVEEKRRGLSSLFSSTPSIVEVVEEAEEWDQVLDTTVSEIDLRWGKVNLLF